LRRFKGRDRDAPVSILVDRADALAALGFEPGPAARALAGRFWPGPLTLVMPCAQRFAAGVARDDGAVGVRCSPHPLAASLAKRLLASGVGPITATSLNLSGEPPARCRDEARALCVGADAPWLLDLGSDAPDAGGGEPSTVVDVCAASPRVLREGAIGERALAEALEGIAA